MKRPTEAWMSEDFEGLGIGHVVVARFKGSGEAEVGVFLVDTKCLGVKDAFFSRLTALQYEEDLLNRIFSESGRKSVPPSAARAFVEQAIAYAQDFGLAPHSDYKQAARVFGGIDATECKETFRFGDNGKPCYIQGPHDDEARILRVLECLLRKCGSEFHYVVSNSAFTPRVEAMLNRIETEMGRPSRIIVDNESTRN